ncbi:MAG: S-methyl-5'-thioadenosine phosphorylase [Chloroflexi bacterium]|nr:S-methyl-5'-thioadenosine phosphorylase [Chloroflexota bacterium]
MEQRTPVLGVIGGSGIYQLEGLTSIEQRAIDTPFGAPSSPIVLGELAGRRVAFLARHGIGHTIPPAEVNYRANIYALKSLGVPRVLSISACGSLREDYAPGDVVVPDQLFDRTCGRQASFFEAGLVAHISVAEPFCGELSAALGESVTRAGGQLHRGGALVTINGPRFSTRAESNTYRAWGMSIIGMTTTPEAFLAREAEMCYAVMAHVTDYDVWHIAEAPVSVEMVVRTLNANTRLAQATLAALVQSLPAERGCACGEALHDALITSRLNVAPELRRKLSLLVERYLA